MASQIADNSTICRNYHIEATIMEIQRFSSISPVTMMHATTADCEYRGYNIPKHTEVRFKQKSVSMETNSKLHQDCKLGEYFLGIRFALDVISSNQIVLSLKGKCRHLDEMCAVPDDVNIAISVAANDKDINNISYPLFADADTGIYPHAASQYHARPKAKHGIAMLSVDKFPYPRKETRGNEFIPCSNNICDILKRFHSFKIPAITLIWPKSSYKHSVTRSYRSGKESGRRSESPL